MKPTRLRLCCALFLLLAPVACATIEPETGPAELPVTRWDHRPEADQWSRATLRALKAEGAELLSHVPDDVGEYCPAYEARGTQARAAFWAGYLSALAKYESRWNPEAAGAGGRYRGLLQIAPATARNFGCDATSLYNGAANLQCAVRIIASEVPRLGGIVRAGSGRGGIGAHWPPSRKPENRAEIAAFTSQQTYCR